MRTHLPLVERQAALDQLLTELPSAGPAAGGRIVLISGEAGVGKTSLLEAFLADAGETHRVLLGRCDALFTPASLGPFRDIAAAVGGRLGSLVGATARPHEVAAELLEELRRVPTVLAIEDLHWADEASLDVVSLLSRRLDGIPVLVLATYRDDELGPTHPLRIVVGELATHPDVERLPLAPLSRDGVAELVGTRAFDVEALHRRTGGNPFFVCEVVATGTEEIPSTVREAILARTARLSAPTRAVLDAVAIVPDGCEYWLLDALVGPDAAQLDDAVAAGILYPEAAHVRFRHELARLAVDDSIPAARRRGLHRSALDALAARDPADPARLAHHAEATDDHDAVLHYAPLAGDAAAAVGAHREAAEHYRQGIESIRRRDVAPLGELHERRAYCLYLSGDFPVAIGSQRLALAHFRERGDRLRHGRAARTLALLLRYDGDLAAAWELGHEAVDVLEPLGPSHELAMAYCALAHVAVNAEDAPAAETWSARARDLATSLGDDDARVYDELNRAAMQAIVGDPESTASLERALRDAQDRHLEEQAGRAYVGLCWWSVRGRTYRVADRYVDEGLDYCHERGLDLWRSYLLAYRARASLDRGQWDAAAAAAAAVLRNPNTSPIPRVVAESVVAVGQARRGEDDPGESLDRAWAEVRDTGELQRMEPVTIARAEVMWLFGRTDEVAEATAATLDLAIRRGASWVVGEMLLARHRAGVPVDPSTAVPEPFTAELAGDCERAHDRWLELDSPYDAALALAGSTDERAVQQALGDLQTLGAVQAAAIVARRLRDRGVQGVRRGPRRATRSNPAQLTDRELEVLSLLADGLLNREIANRLVLSTRTVDHHVAAILRKLDAGSRSEAAAAAGRLGIGGGRPGSQAR
jgi:DNA-binding CsgD family transcriptional regulator/tetratricopeptide (TPR) repeat protein